MMGLSSRPCIPTVLTFLMLLQLTFKVSLQEETAPNGVDPRTEIAIRELEHLKSQMKQFQVQLSRLEKMTLNSLKVLLGRGGEIVGGKIFRMQEERGTFQHGEIACEYNLALPRNEAENTALQNILERPGEMAILGITYNKAENKFEDLNGQPLEYSKWAAGEPKILEGQDCVLIKSGGKWKTDDCNKDSWAIICEFKI